MQDNKIITSIIIPVRNEEKYIENCIISILDQDYPKEKMELIFVDGDSTDKTKNIINKYIKTSKVIIKIINNPQKTVPFAMNKGIKISKGTYIIRLDAHSSYTNTYISACINTIEKTNADNVGALAITKGEGPIGSVFSRILSSKFGVGNSSFRTKGNSGYVDTVPFGTFQRSVFEKYGYYDERLDRNQDYELNYRIRKNGGKIYLNSDIEFSYYCRNTFFGIIKQSFENGKWNIITSKLCPGTMSLRHFIPFLFVLSLILLSILSFNIFFFILLFIEILLYLTIDIIFSMRENNVIRDFLLSILLYPVFHISYGTGSFFGFFNFTHK